MTLKVNRWTVIEGPLYEIPGEGGMLALFDCEIVAVTDNGLYYKDLRVSGLGGYTEDGFPFPNTNYKADCQAILAKLSLPCEIDTDQWFFIPEMPPLEVRLDMEATIENAARNNLPEIAYPYTMFQEWRGDSDGTVGVD